MDANILIKLQFEDDNTCKEEFIESDEIEEVLCKCHILPNDIVLAFRRHHIFFYDADLKHLNRVSWSE